MGAFEVVFIGRKKSETSFDKHIKFISAVDRDTAREIILKSFEDVHHVSFKKVSFSECKKKYDCGGFHCTNEKLCFQPWNKEEA